LPGVSQKVLWHVGGFRQALVRYEPGASTPGEPHLAAHHHIWVTHGELTFADHRMTAGSYAHVPPGHAHAAVDVGPDGCTLLQMHRPHPPLESQLLAERDRDLAHVRADDESLTTRSAPEETAVGQRSYAAPGMKDSS
jgi:glyoxylate utilization-related uncharacterized protein